MRLTYNITDYEQDSYLHVATYLPLGRQRYSLGFMVMTWRLIQQLKNTSGLLRFSLKAHPLSKDYWTYSIWTDRASMNRFVGQKPHTVALKKFKKWAGEGAAFVEWHAASEQIDWSSALQKLQNPTYYYG